MWRIIVLAYPQELFLAVNNKECVGLISKCKDLCKSIDVYVVFEAP